MCRRPGRPRLYQESVKVSVLISTRRFDELDEEARRRREPLADVLRRRLGVSDSENSQREN